MGRNEVERGDGVVMSAGMDDDVTTHIPMTYSMKI